MRELNNFTSAVWMPGFPTYNIKANIGLNLTIEKMRQRLKDETNNISKFIFKMRRDLK